MRRLDATCIRATSLAAADTLGSAIALILIVLFSATSLAATRSWDGGGGTDTDWTTDANWSSNIEPVASDTAEFDRGLGFVYTVTFPLLPLSVDETTDRLIVGSNTVTFGNDRSNTNYLVTTPVTDELGRGVIIGEEANDTAAVLISHLDLLSTAAATLGHVAGSSGTLTLDQNNDQFNVTGSAADAELIIGRFGTGVLNVSAGADVNVSGALGNVFLAENAGSSGTASIGGAGSTLSVAGSLGIGVAGNGTLGVTSGGAVNSTSLTVGSAGTGTLNVTSGGNVMSTTTVLGQGGTGDAFVTITGAGSTWNIATSLTAGRGGDATLDITSGGNVSSTTGILGEFGASVSSVTVSGIDSDWKNLGNLYVGGSATAEGGQGTLSITDHGEVDVDGTLKIWPRGNVLLNGGTLETELVEVADGSFSWTSGTLDLGSDLVIEPGGLVGGALTMGVGKFLELAGDLYVGHVGNGSLEINGGKVVVPFGGDNDSFVGDSDSTGEVIITGFGEWTTGRILLENGSITVSSGQILTGQLLIIPGTGSTGAVIVDGPSSRILIGVPIPGIVELNVGSLGIGSLEIRNGGEVDLLFADDGNASVSPGSSLIVDGPGSKFSARQLTVGGSASVTNGGTMTVLTSVFIVPQGEFDAEGQVVGSIENAGILAPGSSPGVLEVDGDFAQTGEGELRIELASASSFDQLLVTGAATLSGALTVNLLDGFVPSPGQSFTFLTADDIDGVFTIEPVSSVPGLIFDVVYNSQSVVLQILAAGIAGDYNADGTVDAADYVVWRKNNNTATTLPNDSTPGTSAADYDVWRAHFGESVGSGAGAIGTASRAVPEPASQVMLVIGVLAMFLRRRG